MGVATKGEGLGLLQFNQVLSCRSTCCLSLSERLKIELIHGYSGSAAPHTAGGIRTNLQRVRGETVQHIEEMEEEMDRHCSW